MSIPIRPRSSDKRRRTISATIGIPLSWLAVLIMLVSAIYLAGISTGAVSEDFAFLVVPP